MTAAPAAMVHMNLRPLYDRVVVKRIDGPMATVSGIVIPDSAKEKPQEAEVIAVGTGKRRDDGTLAALDVQVGDRILIAQHSGNETEMDGVEYLVIREEDILGVLGAV